MQAGSMIAGWVLGVAILVAASPASADTHAPWPGDWNNWSDPNLWTTVANPGNSADNTGYGAVSYIYHMGKFEVTAGQYTAFLNAVAATDTYDLYSPNMGDLTNFAGCNIQRTGSPGSYVYSVEANGANRPVNYVSWGDAARFANWLTHGQPTGAQDANTTEDGSYYLNGATTHSALQGVTRKTSAQGGRYFIPTEDEWYKAAYYDPNKSGGAGYWDYPMASDSGASNLLLAGDGGNNANFCDSNYTLGQPYWRTEAGDFENSPSPYGTFDQGGNVLEWDEAVINSSSRGLRGGAFSYFAGSLLATYRDDGSPSYENRVIGFRLCQTPEPASLVVLTLGGLGLIRRRRVLRT